jgi:N-acetylglutamate synthase-like GNAT family acetyltransferase
MKYFKNDKVSYEELQLFFAKMDVDSDSRFSNRNLLHLDNRTKPQEKRSISKALFFTARVNLELIGYVKGITDEAYHLFIPEVMILPEYQHRGIGKRLMELAVEYARDKKMFKVFLFAIPSRESYYEQFDFKKSLSQAMEIRLC